MAAEVFATTGTRIFIGPQVAGTLALEDDEGLSASFTEIDPVESIGKFGDEAQEIKFTSLKDGRVRKTKGPRDAGSMTLVCGWSATDLGQIALIAAQETNNKFAFKVVFPDAPTDSGTDTIVYFRALVSSDPYNAGTGGDVLRREFSVSIDSELYEILAAA